MRNEALAAFANYRESPRRGGENRGSGANRRLVVPGGAEEMVGRGHFACIKRGRG